MKTTILALCKCIIRRLDAVLAQLAKIEATQAQITATQAEILSEMLYNQTANNQRLTSIEATVAQIDAAVEEPQIEAAGFKLTLTTKE